MIEMLVVILIVAILATVIIMQVKGTPSSAHQAAKASAETDVTTQVSAYYLKSGLYPTQTKTLPKEGEYALITWDASFTLEGKTYKFVPDFITKAPPHADEGLWRVDYTGRASVDIDPDKY
ncbi:MAG: type II secretion system protein [Chloroflexi bacterium]|nr:type II secretion system protein [Chloroflexota bacterium]